MINFFAFRHKSNGQWLERSFDCIVLSFSAGQLSLDTTLDLITYLKSETHNVPLIQGLGYMEAFYKMVEKRSLSDVTQNVKVSPDTFHSLNLSMTSNLYLMMHKSPTPLTQHFVMVGAGLHLAVLPRSD